MSRPRSLTDADIELWLKIVRTVMPRPGAKVPAIAPTVEPPPPLSPPPPKFLPAPDRLPTAANYTPRLSTPRSGLPLAAFERRYRKKVAGGRVGIDDALDLHGMTQARAHGALVAFLSRAQANGGQLVLVVTGKGGPNRRQGEGGGETGVLRRAVPHWLSDKALRPIVLGFEEAAQAHGGAGALYIRLRRRSNAD